MNLYAHVYARVYVPLCGFTKIRQTQTQHRHTAVSTHTLGTRTDRTKTACDLELQTARDLILDCDDQNSKTVVSLAFHDYRLTSGPKAIAAALSSAIAAIQRTGLWSVTPMMAAR